MLQKKEIARKETLWTNGDYLLLWSGQLVSSGGSQVSQLAFPLLILFITHSSAQAGLVTALWALPYFFFSLPAGALIDRLDRKKVMIICDIGRALAMGSIPLALFIHHLTVIQLYIVALIEGSLFVFFNLAETACLPRVVSKELLPAATAQNTATDGLTGMLGPSLGGLLYTIGAIFPFFVDAISYFISVLSLLCIKTQFQAEKEIISRNIWEEIKEGLVWLWQQSFVRFIAILNCGIFIITAGSSLVVIVLAQSFHLSAFEVGIIFSIGGIGGLIGSLVASPIQRKYNIKQLITIIVWVMTVLWALYIFTPNAIILGLVTAANFTIGPIYNVSQYSYRLSLIPDRLQGRVNSVFRLIAFSGRPIGIALTGLLIQLLSIRPSILVLSAAFLFLSIMSTIYIVISKEN